MTICALSFYTSAATHLEPHPLHAENRVLRSVTYYPPMQAPLNRCSLADCQQADDWFSWPADKAKVASTILPGKYVVKDTVNMPFGGYVVTRFVANNPGQWIAHGDTDGMGVILRDAAKGQHDTPFMMPDDFPQCVGMAFEAGDSSYIDMNARPACECLSPIDEPTLRSEPGVGWRCSTSYNCRHVPVGQTLDQQKLRARGLVRSSWSTPFDSNEAEAGRRWVQRSITLTITCFVLLVLTAVLLKWKPSDIKGHTDQTGVHLHLVWRAIFAEEFPKRLSFLNMASALGLSTVAGLIYLDAGFNDLSERKYGEKISLVFWQVAFWSVSTVYGAAVSYHSPRWFVFGGKMVHAELKLNEMQGKTTVHFEVTKPTGTLPKTPPCLEMIQVPVIGREPYFTALPRSKPGAKAITGPEATTPRSEAGSPSAADYADAYAPRATHAAAGIASAGPAECPIRARSSSAVLEINGPTNRRPPFLSPSKSMNRLMPTVSKGIDSFKGSINEMSSSFKIKEHSVIATEIWKYHALRFVASLMLSSPWPMLYALVIDCFAALSPSVGSTILVGLTLVLTSQAFEAMGRMLSEFAGASGIAVAVTFASIFSQLLVIAGGFYKTVTFPLFAWMGHINAIKYGFSAVAKTYFKSTDSFWVTPPNAIAVRGYTWSSIEFMGAFNTLRTRGVTVVDSLNPPSIGFDITMLIVLCMFFRVICFGSALFRANGGTFWKITRCLIKEEAAKCPEEKAHEVSIADIEEAFDSSGIFLSNPLLQSEIVKRLEENIQANQVGRAAVADKPFF